MKSEIKVLHVSEVRTAKNGTKYRKAVVLTIIDGIEFLDIRYLYQR